MKKNFIFISESVTEGHPDKLCDQVSDAIVDQYLKQDPFASVIAECAASTSIVFIAARFHSEAVVDYATVARKVINRIGYDQHDFSGRTCSILTSLKELPLAEHRNFDETQLAEDEIDRIPVRNQVTVFGYACNQGSSLMPLPVWLANKLAKRLTEMRQSRTLPWLAPDGNTQVGIEFRERRPFRIHSIAVKASQNHPSEPSLERLRQEILEAVILPVFAEQEIKPDGGTTIFVNPEGPFLMGGPAHHSGLTGRKNAIDTYGEYSRHSGAALSGKDPTRIDRVAAYAARYAAKNVVAAQLAEECEIQLSYSIGLSRPVSIQVETFGTGVVPDEDLTALVDWHFDFRLAAILRQFQLRHLPARAKGSFYQRLAAYGHLGRDDMELPWEATDKAALLADETRRP